MKYYVPVFVLLVPRIDFYFFLVLSSSLAAASSTSVATSTSTAAEQNGASTVSAMTMMTTRRRGKKMGVFNSRQLEEEIEEEEQHVVVTSSEDLAELSHFVEDSSLDYEKDGMSFPLETSPDDEGDTMEDSITENPANEQEEQSPQQSSTTEVDDEDEDEKEGDSLLEDVEEEEQEETVVETPAVDSVTQDEQATNVPDFSIRTEVIVDFLLEYGFLADGPALQKPTEEEVDALMSSTEDFYMTWLSSSSNNSITIDNYELASFDITNWKLGFTNPDTNVDFPVLVECTATLMYSLLDMAGNNDLDEELVYSAMDAADYESYIYDYVWQSLPDESTFGYVQSVLFTPLPPPTDDDVNNGG